MITILFDGETRAVYERFVKRDQSPERHRGHVVNDRYPEVGAPAEVKTLSFDAFEQKYRAARIPALFNRHADPGRLHGSGPHRRGKTGATNPGTDGRMIMTEATAGLADRLAKLKRRVWQETYTGIYPAQKLLEFDEAQHAEKFRRLITDPANQVVLLREERAGRRLFCAGKPRPGWTGPPISVQRPLFDIGFSTSRAGTAGLAGN